MFLGLLFAATPALAQERGENRGSGSVVQSIFDSLERARESRQERARQAQEEQRASQQEVAADGQTATSTATSTSTVAAATTTAAAARPDAPVAQQPAAAAISALGDQNGTPQAGVYEAEGLSAAQMRILLTAALAMAVGGFLLVERGTLERLLAAGPARRTHSLRV
ncbi:MAG: hypothetical protein JWL87_154 [Candidatus Adlerbacteria bacterium]|nr:hypothetical protein [Candidatus Adlerbacteria bacterium]